MAHDPRKAAEARVGTTIQGKWTITRLIDVGGMAAVYAAEHRNGKKVALKILLPLIAREPQIRERFLREGYVANKVGHPGAVSVDDDGTAEDGGVFLVMELLEGESIDGWLRRIKRRPRPEEVLAVADQTLDVLAAAHDKGIIHRDIKPANLFMTREGRVKVLDFGLARVRDGSVSAAPTAMGTVLGTAQYMPPEQARGKMNLIDGRTDVFAVGAVMFRAMTGKYVHDSTSSYEHSILVAMKEVARPIRTVLPNVPASIAAIVDKALQFDRDNRWPSARAMQVAVRQAFEDLKKNPPPPDPDIPIEIDLDEPSSLVVDVSFGGK